MRCAVKPARLIEGAIAGLVATGPMTVAMVLLHRYLPVTEQYALPPREITMEMAEGAGIEHCLDASQRTALSMAAHFGFGTTAGIIYALVHSSIPLPSMVKGMGYGLIVWAGSYLGFVPALGLLRPATQHPRRRNVLMLVSHAVWGVTAALMLDEIDRGGAIAGRVRESGDRR